MKLAAALAAVRDELIRGGAGEAEARAQSRLLLGHLLGRAPADLARCLWQEVDIAPLAPLVAALLRGEPLQYLLGETEFMGLPFFCTPAALIPRPDSEILVETALAELEADKIPAPRLVDLCCGGGCLGLSLAHYLPQARLLATDISAAALELAQRNAVRLGLASRVRFRCGDLLAALDGELPADLIIANPPYIPGAELDSLPAAVQREPRLALDGGGDGLSFYRRLAAGAGRWLQPGGLLLLEHGDDQQQAVIDLLEQAGLVAIRPLRDYGQRPRGVLCRKPATGWDEE